jgi:hypothetical protein
MTRRMDIAALGLGVLLLALGPLVLTLLRAEDYRSVATIALNAQNPSAAYLPDPRPLVEGSLDLGDLQRQVAKEVGWFDAPDDLGDYVDVSERGSGVSREYLLSARGPSPEDASDLARASATRVLSAVQTSTGFTQALQLRRLTAALREDPDAPGVEQLRSRREEIAAAVREERPLFAARPSAATLPEERFGDRLLGALPGDRPLRPNPLWAALAGIALAAVLLLCVMVLGPAEARRPAE